MKVTAEQVAQVRGDERLRLAPAIFLAFDFYDDDPERAAHRTYKLFVEGRLMSKVSVPAEGRWAPSDDDVADMLTKGAAGRIAYWRRSTERWESTDG